ncbi:MAG: hypothetical protein A2Z20_07750 [Bdellovibrionales bacterium RBG_16_40_8]|nr:MAG: hypothetical protein A2Z20_07750 [Bdellovibrionales bacterium RBG_16_40_8]
MIFALESFLFQASEASGLSSIPNIASERVLPRSDFSLPVFVSTFAIPHESFFIQYFARFIKILAWALEYLLPREL